MAKVKQLCMGFLFHEDFAKQLRFTTVHFPGDGGIMQRAGVFGAIPDGGWPDAAMTKAWRDKTGTDLDWHGTAKGLCYFRQYWIHVLAQKVTCKQYVKLADENRKAVQNSEHVRFLFDYPVCLAHVLNLEPSLEAMLRCCLTAKRFELTFD